MKLASKVRVSHLISGRMTMADTLMKVSKLIDKLPSYLETVRLRLLPWLNERFGVSTDLLDMDKIVGLLRAHWQSAGGIATTVLATVGKSGLALLGWVVNLTLIPVLLFYFLL